MRATILMTLVAALLCSAQVAKAQNLSADRLARLGLTEPAEDLDVYANWADALGASSLDWEKPAIFTPVSYRDGKALYRMQAFENGAAKAGESELVWVRVESDPTLEPGPAELEELYGPEPVEGVEIANRGCAPGSPRCDVPFSTVLGHNKRCLIRLFHNPNFQTRLVNTDHDWNTMHGWGSPYPDRTSSIQTTCHGGFFFEHHHFGGTMLYVPPNTNMASLGSMSNKISSLLHIIP